MGQVKVIKELRDLEWKVLVIWECEVSNEKLIRDRFKLIKKVLKTWSYPRKVSQKELEYILENSITKICGGIRIGWTQKTPPVDPIQNSNQALRTSKSTPNASHSASQNDKWATA